MGHMTTERSPLRDARIRAGLVQEALAELTGRSQPFISRVENGTLRGRQDFYERAAVVLNCAPADLLPPVAEDVEE